MILHFAYGYLIYLLLPILLGIALFRWFIYKSPVYVYPLTQELINKELIYSSMQKPILYMLRLLTLFCLMLLIMRPQWIDERSKVSVNGIDIMLAIDISDSMQLFDDLKDQRSRINVAKQEALRFTEKRLDDPIGVVLFGKEALSWCPLTLDKKILKEKIGSITLGMIDPNGTWLGTGLATSVNRLRKSEAKSRVIILLTDGQPTPGEKVDPTLATEIAKKFGIKIYTVGIGSENGGYIKGPFSSVMPVGESQLNTKLLQSIAEKTGGKFFRAKNPKDMRTIYDTIDALEKTEHQTDVYHRYYEAFLSFIWIVLAILGCELMLRFFIWRGLL